ncbi:nucleic acid-binding protein, partial [Caulochytrium protostelioides]
MTGIPGWTSRPTGAKKCFVELRQRTHTVQGVVAVDETQVSKHMVKWVGKQPVETLVRCHAHVLAPKEPVTGCTVQDAELHVREMYAIAVADRLPFSLEDASRPEAELEKDETFNRVALDTRLNHRIIDLRTTTNHAIFRIQHAVSRLFREQLESQHF